MKIDSEKILKSKSFAVIFLIWVLVINFFYYLQFKDIYLMFLKKLGIMK